MRNTVGVDGRGGVRGRRLRLRITIRIKNGTEGRLRAFAGDGDAADVEFGRDDFEAEVRAVLL